MRFSTSTTATVALSAALALAGAALVPATASAATKRPARAGAACGKAGAAATVGGQQLRCTKVGRRLVWKAPSKATPAPVATPAPAPAPAPAAAGILPDGNWTCAMTLPGLGYQNYSMVVSGFSYTMSGQSGTYSRGTHQVYQGGVPVSFDTGGWHGMIGEYLVKGTPDINGIPSYQDVVKLRTPDTYSYSVTCSH